MNPYQQKQRWKYFLLAFAVVIASGSLLYTNYLVKNIAKSERGRANVWAMSMKQMLASDDADFLNYVMAVRDSSNVPSIIVDERGEIQLSHGLDSSKTFIKPTPEGNKKLKYDPGYFESELANMKKQHAPIRLTVLGKQWLIYYRDSDLLTELKYFPYIQLSVIFIFLLTAYTAFSSSRKSEQDQVWVGLAKETAHQLGTPISSLMAWIELMKEKFNAEEDPLIAEMENDVKRLEIVADRFSKIGSTPKLEEHKVYEVVKDYVDYFRVRVSKNINFEMRGNTSLTLSRRWEIDEYIHSISTIHRAAVRMSTMVDDLLLLARADAQELQSVAEQIDVADLLREAIDLAPAYRERTVLHEIPGDPVKVCGSASLLARLFANILANADKFSDSKTSIIVSVHKTNAWAMIEIVDEGQGIAPEDLPYVTDRFYQVDPARSQKSGGSGLGLAICKSIVELHRGTLDIQSTQGKGTTVTVMLPIS